MANWVSLQKVDTGFIFAATHSISGNPWSWISDVISDEFECAADDLDLVDDEDGEFVVLNGARIVQIHNCRMLNDARLSSARMGVAA